MAKKQRVVKPAVGKGPEVVEAPKQPEVKFGIKLEVIGSEPVTLQGVDAPMAQRIHSWFTGAGHWAMEVPVGNGMILLDRNKVGYVVISEMVETAGEVDDQD